MSSDHANTVLVAGGRGFIGRAVGKLVQRTGIKVISLDRSDPGGSGEEGRKEVDCDLTDAARLRVIFEKERVGAIIHLAAILPTAARRNPGSATQVNVQGSLYLLDLAIEFGVRRFVFGSSLSIYGSYPNDRVVSETDRAAPEDLYGAAKLYVEHLGEAYRQAHGVEFVSLRIGRVVGPGSRSATSGWRSEIFERLGTESAAEIEIPYADSERILLVHVEDVAKMLQHLLLAPRPAHSVYNASCESVIVGQLKNAIERLNPRLMVKLGGQSVVGNPRRIEWSRFAGEFGFGTMPILEQLDRAAAGHG